MKADKKKAKNLQLILILAGMILGGAVGFFWEDATVLPVHKECVAWYILNNRRESPWL